MATGSGKPDKALKEKQNKLTLMGKVLHRDKHDKHNKKDRETKATSRDLETVIKDTVAKEEMGAGNSEEKVPGKSSEEKVSGKSKSSLMDKVLMRDKSDKHNRKDRNSKVPSKDLDVAKDTVGRDDELEAGSEGDAGKSKTSFMDKVLMRDKSDKHTRKDRDSKVPSKDLDVARGDDDGNGEEVVAKQHKTSLMEKVFLRGSFDRLSKRDRSSKSRSKDFEDLKVTVTKEEYEESDSVARLLSDVPKQQKSTLIDEVKLRHEKVAKKEKELKIASVDLDHKFKSTSMGDLRHVDGSVHFRDRVDRSQRKKENRRSSSSVYK